MTCYRISGEADARRPTLESKLTPSAANGRAFVLQTTFPPRQLSDEETIEGAKLANSVVVQRLT